MRGLIFTLLPGVPEAIGRLNRAGLRVIVVSNQRGVALGLFSAAAVEAIQLVFRNCWRRTERMSMPSSIARMTGWNATAASRCRGCLSRRGASFPRSAPHRSAMVGDSLPDIEFGRRLGMLTVFIEGAAERQKPGAEKARELAMLRFPSLAAAVDGLLEGR